ncbi:TIGR03899 family protein [Dongshaea marina]|uniref:TIGR03899 family protein n=1 Tax=Dongshaea marina TaxID=2047966 RepID=UPI000D3EADC8|nr:TIGR03899 family protein [Dongshaea marina]
MSKTPARTEHHLLTAKEKVTEIARRRGIDAEITGRTQISLEERTQYRLQLEARASQQNLELIMAQAARQSDDNSANEIDPDWLTCFLSLVEKVAAPTMQQLWGRILAKEIATPGSFSVKSMKVLQQMTLREARTFQRARQLSSHYGGDQGLKLMQGYHQDSGFLQRMETHKLTLGKYRLPFNSLLQLADLGLIHASELESGEVNSQGVKLVYQKTSWLLRPKHKKIRLIYYRFTPIGNELALLIPNDTHQEYADDLEALLLKGFILEE